MNNDKLYFTTPPSKWEEFLPLGNGRLGLMQKADPTNECLQLNEEGIWSGGPQDRNNPDTKKYLAEIQNLVKNGNIQRAQELAFETMSGTSFNERVYQTAGDFHIDFFSEKNYGIQGPLSQHPQDKVALENYQALLDLSQAASFITYTDEEGVTFNRKVWVSAIDDMIFMHVTASQKGKINFRGYLDRGIWCDSIYADSENNFIFLEDSHGIPFTLGVGLITKAGSCETRGVCLTGEACDEVLFFIDIQGFSWNKKIKDKKTYDKMIKKNYWSKNCKEKLLKIKNYILEKTFDTALEDIFAWHLVEYSSYWDRMEIFIGDKDSPSDKKLIETPLLLASADIGNVELVNLYSNFSRYLLISSSRAPATLPATLQGLWNCYMDPPWGSKYTININTQMNYWPSNICNLSDCELPLFELLERAYKNGLESAKKMYACRGYVIHHNLDFWGDSAPQDNWIPGTYWTLGAAWIATHIYEHFEYTKDMDFLEKYYYLLHEAALFFVDFLTPCDLLNEKGENYLVINPSVSPENSYISKAGEIGAFSEGCQMDNMILRHLFESCLFASKILKNKAHSKKGKAYDKKDFSDFEYVLDHLKKPELNSDGTLMEWNMQVEEIEPGHRHISHLYGLYPGHSITEKDSELIEAAKKTLEKRLSFGGGHTGWSQSWINNFRAQLGQGDLLSEGLVKLFKHSTLPNLLDNHPPFQIDGNFGSLAAIVRIFVQSELNEEGHVCVKLLPALPQDKNWQKGYVRGLCLKGGYTINFAFEDGKAKDIQILNKEGKLSNNEVIFL